MSETNSQQKSEMPASQSRTRPKKRDRSASEERLLKAAEDVFAKHGFKGATTRMIADKAKVNESLIGRYFDGKMGLLFSLIEIHIEESPLCALPYPAQDNVRDELRMLIESMIDRHLEKDTEFFKIVLSQCLVDAKFLKRIREISPMKINPELYSRLEVLKKKGKIKKDTDLDLLTHTIDNFFHGKMLFDEILLGQPEAEVRRAIHYGIEAFAHFVES